MGPEKKNPRYFTIDAEYATLGSISPINNVHEQEAAQHVIFHIYLTAPAARELYM